MLGYTEENESGQKARLREGPEVKYKFTEDTIIDQNTLSHRASDTTEKNGIGAS